MKDLKMVLTPSLYVFVAEIESMIADGYAVDYENNPPTTFGFCYEVGMIKKVDAHSDVFLQKPSIAEELVVFKEAAEQKKQGRPKRTI